MIKRQKVYARISLTPLIDVVFILLIFFMTTMNLQHLKSLEISLPKTVGDTTKDKTNKPTIIFTITKDGATIGKTKLNGVRAIITHIQTYNKPAVWGISPSKNITTDTFLKVWKKISDAGITVNIITPKINKKKDGVK